MCFITPAIEVIFSHEIYNMGSIYRKRPVKLGQVIPGDIIPGVK
jgi:hypothetical protein